MAAVWGFVWGGFFSRLECLCTSLFLEKKLEIGVIRIYGQGLGLGLGLDTCYVIKVLKFIELCSAFGIEISE